MSRHAKLAPSAAGRWMNCAGSVRLIGDEESEANQYGAEGSFAHHIAAEVLKGGGLTAKEWLGNKTIVDGFVVECTQEMVDAIDMYVQYCQSMRQHIDDVVGIEQSLHEVMATHIDQDTGGTPDFFRYRERTKHLFLADFKYGQGVFVGADDNLQLLTYAAGAMFAVDKPVEDVTLAIVQPRHEVGEPIREWKFKAVDIMEHLAKVQAAAKLTRDVDAPVTPGSWCKWCPAKVKCPAIEATVNAVVAAGFALPTDPARISKALDVVPTLKDWIKAVESHAYKLAAGGVKVPGYKLVATQPRRKFKEDVDVPTFAVSHGLELADCFSEPTLLSPAQLEKKLDKTGKKELADLVEKVSSGTTLVADSDKRPEARTVEESDFATIDGEYTDLDSLL